jgi:hypothetical protein
MNVYFAGGEDIDFAGAPAVIAGAPYSDTAWCRCAVGVATGSTTWPNAGSISNPASFGNLSSFWFHCGFYPPTSTALNNIVIGFADSGGVGRLLIRATATIGQFKISSRNAAGTITDMVTGSQAFSAQGLHKIDVFVNYSTSGQVQLYIDGVLNADTGAGVNVTTDSATSLSYVYLGAATTSASDTWYSQVIVADSDTRAAGLWLMNSTTAGNAQTWTGTATGVNKATISDTTFISAASAGLINEYKTGGIALPAGTWSVPAVVMSSRALAGASAPQHVEYVTRVGSADYVGGSWAPPNGSFANNGNYIQATNPGTGVAWTTGDLTATTFNYGVESVT